MTVKQISEKLAERAEQIARLLLPCGTAIASEWVCGGIDGQSGKSLKVKLSGEFTGKWKDWNGGEGGDLIDLWAMQKGMPLSSALLEIKSYLGISEPVATLSKKSYTKPCDNIPAINEEGIAMNWLYDKRKIVPIAVNRFKVQADASREAIVFPCYGLDGELKNRSYRKIATKDGKKEVWQDKGGAPCLFGWQALSDDAFKSRKVLICEGQIDAMTWNQLGIDALSIPNGSGQTWIEYEWDNLEVFDTIYLSYDMDGKSDKNLMETVSRLGKHRCKIVKIEGGKDINDSFIAGATRQDVERWVSEADFIAPKNLVTGDRLSNEVVELVFPKNAETLGVTTTHTEHPFDSSKNFYFRPGETTLWTGYSGDGKSTILSGVMMQLSFHTKRPCLVLSMETVPQKVLLTCIKTAGVSFFSEESVRRAVATYGPNFLFAAKIGQISMTDLWEIVKYAHQRYDVRHVFLDSLMRVQGLEEEYTKQGELFCEIATFAKETGIHMHIVTHPRKPNNDNEVSASDIKGSGHIRDNADNILIMRRNKEMDEAVDVGTSPDIPAAWLKVAKDREGSGEIRTFQLSFDKSTKNFNPFIKQKAELREHPNARKR